MTAWWVKHLKHIELYKWYKKQPKPKCKRAKFCARVVRYGYDREKALTTANLQSEKMMKRYWSEIREGGRVCNKCREYKLRDKFARSKVWVKGYTSICKECRNKKHQEYRMNWGYEKDHEYKRKTRKLKAYEKIVWNWEVYSVLGYTYKKWYRIGNKNGIRYISLGDNKTSAKVTKYNERKPNLYTDIRPILTMPEVKKEEIKVKEDNCPTIELPPEVEKEKKFKIDLEELLNNYE